MYLGKLGEQIVLKSKKAFHHLTFQEAIYAEKETYYPKKMNRDQGAREAFRSEPVSYTHLASFGGLAALLSMLNSCANGIGVVNIDNGYGAACLANKIMKR